jgi:hypothetical protein
MKIDLFSKLCKDGPFLNPFGALKGCVKRHICTLQEWTCFVFCTKRLQLCFYFDSSAYESEKSYV